MNQTELTELDRLLAEKVMGWRLTEDHWWLDRQNYHALFNISAWHPTTDIAQAMMVAEKIGEYKDCVLSYHNSTRAYVYDLYPIDFYNVEFSSGECKTPTLAICLAARAWLSANETQK